MKAQNFYVSWKMDSKFGEVTYLPYVNTFTGVVRVPNYELDVYELAGVVQVRQLLFSAAINNEFPISDIVEAEELLYEITSQICDIKAYEFNSEVRQHFDDTFDGWDLTIITRLEILQKQKNKGLEKLILKDIINRFGSHSGLVVVYLKELPFEENEIFNEEWFNTWEMESKIFGKESVSEKVEFYKNLGFSVLDKFPTLALYNFCLINNELDKVSLHNLKIQK